MSTSSKFDLDTLDAALSDILSAFQSCKDTLSTSEQFYAQLWFDKMKEPQSNRTFKMLRNAQAMCLLDMCY